LGIASNSTSILRIDEVAGSPVVAGLLGNYVIGTLSFGLSIELVGEKMLPSSVIDRTKCARLRGVHSKLSVENLI
jgi:hypothetical protein